MDIRIFLNKKKFSYRTVRIKGFLVIEICEDFFKEVKNILLGKKFLDNFGFCFIGEK